LTNYFILIINYYEDFDDKEKLMRNSYLLFVVGIFCFLQTPAEAGGYYPTYPPDYYEKEYSEDYYPDYQANQEQGCPSVYDHSDYYDWENYLSNNQKNQIYKIQRRLSGSTCIVVKLDDCDFVLAVDRSSIRYATDQEIANYSRNQYSGYY
jgi:hypothetical protein